MLFRMATLENKKFNNKILKTQHYILAGAPGFEPGNGGIKIRGTTLIGLHISPDYRERRPFRINTLRANFRLRCIGALYDLPTAGVGFRAPV